MVIATLFVLLFAFMLFGVPVAVALGTTTLLTSFIFTDMDLMGVSSKIFDGLNKYTLMAIPMFILAGSLYQEVHQHQELLNLQKL